MSGDGGFPISRRSLLGAIGAGSTLAALGTGSAWAAPDPLADDGWSVVALPDTQFYAENSSGNELQFAEGQTDWIANNVSEQNIAFVSHEGDLVQNGGSDEEWGNIDGVMGTLDGLVPYSVVPGNHDFVDHGDRLSGIQRFKDTFPPSRFDGSWFGGRGPPDEYTWEGHTGPANLNSYQTFSAGGYDFLHLALEWEAPGTVEDPDTPLGWAQGVLDQHRDMPTILTTHSYLRDTTDEEEGFVERVPPADGALQEKNGMGNQGEVVWNDLVSPNPQIFMVLSGHYHRMASGNFPNHEYHAGEGHIVGENDAGQAVYEMLANYQWEDNGGNSWMRLIRFRPGDGANGSDLIEVETFTPSIPEEEWDPMWTDEFSRFSFSLDFDDRFPDPIETIAFQDGQDGYGGTADTIIHEGNPETSYGDATTISIDASDPPGTENGAHGLLRFDGIVGDGDGQVPPGASVDSATLTLETVANEEGDADADATEIYRLLQQWSEDDTWETAFGGEGVQTDGNVAVTDADDSTGAIPDQPGPETLDVTLSVQAWVDGEANHGLALLSVGGNGWDVATSENGDEPKPKLEVAFTVDGGDSGGSTLSVETNQASGVTETEATLNGNLSDLGDASSADVWFTYWEEGDESTAQTTDAQSLSSTGTFEAAVSGLDEGTTYVFRAEADNGSENAQGTARTFTTSGGEPSVSVETDPATDVSASEATLNGELTDMGGAGSADGWFTYWEEGRRSETELDTTKQMLDSTGPFSSTLPGLNPDTTYVYVAKAEADGEHVQGSEETFTTGSEVGDVNGDGSIDDDDVNAVQEHISGQDVEGFNETRADFDGDGDVDIVDAMGIKNNKTGEGG